MKTILGMDVGGTKIAACVMDAGGNVFVYKECPTEAQAGRERVLANMFRLAQDMGVSKVDKIGVGIPGFLRGQRVASMPHIPGLAGCLLQKVLEKQWGVPVVVENDARCFAWAEWKLGAGKGTKQMIGLTIGTGVGAGVIVDGSLYHGAHGAAGEVGHMRLGHAEWEGLVAGRSWKKDMVHDLAAGMANLICCFDPEIIVVGGGVGRLLPLKEILRVVDGMVLPAVRGRVRIVRGKLGAQGGAVGAGLLAGGKV